MQQDRKFYVYVHHRESDGKVFYIGKGQGRRAHSSKDRNTHWLNTVAKHGFYARIIAQGIPSKCACSFERAMIASIGRQNLTNLTGGGEGSNDPSNATRQLMREAKLGRRQSFEHAEKSRCAKTGKKQPERAVLSLSLAKSRSVINSDGEIFLSVSKAVEEFKRKLGRYISQGNISECAAGRRSNAYGVSWSYDICKTPPFKPTVFQVKAVECISTSQIFSSVQDAKKWVIGWRGMANNQCISDAARSGSTAYGYKWRYI